MMSNVQPWWYQIIPKDFSWSIERSDEINGHSLNLSTVHSRNIPCYMTITHLFIYYYSSKRIEQKKRVYIGCETHFWKEKDNAWNH